MSGALSAALLAIGNELLNGEIQDSNLFYLIQHLTHTGVFVEQAAIARDDPQRIAALLRLLLASRPHLLLVCGGLGPTADDLTLAAIAAALELPLEEQPRAREYVEAHYDRLLAQGYVQRRGPEAARRKMATLPQGATPLPNPVGTAPGVRLEYAGTTLYCLPGVPAELHAIYEDSIAPEVRVLAGASAWVEGALFAQCDDEADLAAPLQDVVARHPHVYIKSLSRPFPDAQEAGLHIIAAARAEAGDIARQWVEVALSDLRLTLARAGIVTRTG